jgi:mannose-6-phosphate isomerase
VIDTALQPIRLAPNLIQRFYRGGERIARFRGIPLNDDHAPEDWVGSTTTVHGDATAGLSVLEDGRPLRDAVASDPEAFLGPEHVARYGADTMLLVKLLDAGERLPVHYHPDDAFAQRHGFEHGKTEAWLIVEADPGAVVWLGFREEVEAQALRGWLDGDSLLPALNELPVAAGDLVFVPAGVPHAIGEGILMVELQQPSDLSVLFEWSAFGLDGAQALAIDPDLESAELGAFRPVEPSDRFFRVQRVGSGTIEPGFSVLVVLEGGGRLGALELGRGDTALLPYAAGAVELEGELDAVRCLPPAGGA